MRRRRTEARMARRDGAKAPPACGAGDSAASRAPSSAPRPGSPAAGWPSRVPATRSVPAHDRSHRRAVDTSGCPATIAIESPGSTHRGRGRGALRMAHGRTHVAGRRQRAECPERSVLRAAIDASPSTRIPARTSIHVLLILLQQRLIAAPGVPVSRRYGRPDSACSCAGSWPAYFRRAMATPPCPRRASSPA
jgi:hypothetical protein